MFTINSNYIDIYMLYIYSHTHNNVCTALEMFISFKLRTPTSHFVPQKIVARNLEVIQAQFVKAIMIQRGKKTKNKTTTIKKKKNY